MKSIIEKILKSRTVVVFGGFETDYGYDGENEYPIETAYGAVECPFCGCYFHCCEIDSEDAILLSKLPLETHENDCIYLEAKNVNI